MRKLTALALTVSAVTVLSGVLTGTALADPPSGTTPAANDVVGVGSDTTQFLFDQISSAQVAADQSVPANNGIKGTNLYSFDATLPGSNPPVTGDMITVKPGVSIARPNGSSAGITELEATTSTTVDFARSSRGRSSTDPSTIAFVAYAGDAVTPAVGQGSPIKELDQADLTAIYSCNTDGSSLTYAELPDDPIAGNNTPIDADLPQSGSGTRAFFLSAINVTTPGACVTSTFEENQANGGNDTDPNSVFPYSVAVALAQNLHASADGIDTTSGKFGFADVNGQFPATKSGKTYVINPNFPSFLKRSVYDVVRKTASTPDGIPAYLEGLFGTASKGGAICKYGSGLVSNFGFTPYTGTLCGSVS